MVESERIDLALRALLACLTELLMIFLHEFESKLSRFDSLLRIYEERRRNNHATITFSFLINNLGALRDSMQKAAQEMSTAVRRNVTSLTRSQSAFREPISD
jgi:Zn-dependent M32 family carboxypeptidase